MSGPQSLELTFMVFTVGLAAALAFPLEKRRQRAAPRTLPYTWGIYVGVQAVIGGILILVTLALRAIFPVSEFSLAKLVVASVTGAVIGWPLIAIGWYTYKRRRIAVVLLTIVGFNPVWWIVNGFYFQHRWDEMTGQEKQPEAGDDADADASLPSDRDAYNGWYRASWARRR